MGLSSGTRLDAYEILAPIGGGVTDPGYAAVKAKIGLPGAKEKSR